MGAPDDVERPDGRSLHRVLDEQENLDLWFASRTLQRKVQQLRIDLGGMETPPENAAAVLAAVGASLARAEGLHRRAAAEKAEAEALRREITDARAAVARDMAMAHDMLLQARAQEAAANAAEVSRRRRATALVDADGEDLRPDPGPVRTPTELIAALRAFRTWGGNPSFRTMAQRCGHRVAASTMCTVLGSNELPERLEVIDAIIEASGGSEEDRRRFATAWRRLALGRIRPTGHAKENAAVPLRPRRTAATADESAPRRRRMAAGRIEERLRGGDDETGTVEPILRPAAGQPGGRP